MKQLNKQKIYTFLWFYEFDIIAAFLKWWMCTFSTEQRVKIVFLKRHPVSAVMAQGLYLGSQTFKILIDSLKSAYQFVNEYSEGGRSSMPWLSMVTKQSKRLSVQSEGVAFAAEAEHHRPIYNVRTSWCPYLKWPEVVISHWCTLV